MFEAPSAPLPVDLVRFVVALSAALETANEAMANHQARTALIAIALAKRLGLNPDRIRDIFFAAILHDVGALSPEEKHELHSGLASYIERHTRVGEELLGSLPYFERASKIVGLHHTSWLLATDKVAGDLCLDGSILALSDTVERSIDRRGFILHQDRAIVAAIAKGSGSAFSKEVTSAFLDLSSCDAFWLDLSLPHAFPAIEGMLPFGRFEIPREALLEVSVFVRSLIDFRSRFTATHSSGVSAAARELGRTMGFDPSALRDLEVAGNMHDIGKMSVGDDILLKPSGLDASEFARMRQHSYHSYHFIRASGIGHNVAAWAGYHHERLDGLGYPFRHGNDALDLGARILAVTDVSTALAENRPYRVGLDRETTLGVVRGMAARGSLDAEVVAALVASYDDVVGAAMLAQSKAAERYEEEVRCGLSAESNRRTERTRS